ASRSAERDPGWLAGGGDAGYPQSSVSHGGSPLTKLGGGGDATAVDASLSPILQRYVAQVARDLGTAPLAHAGKGRAQSAAHGDVADQAPRLMFMMSSGGLTAAELFQGKDAILSGPAAGVVGMAGTGPQAGFAH